MGFNPFKSIKKVVKKIGKGIKKVGRGLKKIMSKIAKPFAKLGPLGTIALGMLMPWAAGAIWTGMTGTSLTLANFGAQAATNIASDSLFKKAIGYVMKGIHWGATKVKNAYQFVSDGISSGMDKLKTKAQEVFGKNADAGDLIKDAVDNGPEIDASIIDKNLAEQAREKELGVSLDVDDATKVTSEAVNDEVIEKNLFQQAKDKVKESALGALGKNVESILNPQPAEEGYSAAYQPYNFLQDIETYTKFNQQDLTLRQNGYTYNGPSFDAGIQGSGFGQTEYYKWFNTYGE